MKLANGMGGVSKCSGHRRKPYCARITTGWTINPETNKPKQIQKVLGYYKTRKEAVEALVLYNQDPYDLDAEKVSFDDCYQNIRFTESTEQNYHCAYKYLQPIADKPIRSIKPAQLQECIDSCTSSQQPLIKTICKRVYHYAMMHEYVEKDISQFITAHAKETEIERKLFTHEEIEELWAYQKKGIWWASITLILLYSGMRTKELRTTPIDCFDFIDGWLDIPSAKNYFSMRGIPLHDCIVPLVSDYYVNGGNLYGYSHAALNKALNEFHGHRAHDTRHTFATRMRECEVDHVIIQRILGHKPSDITYEVYTHISRDELHDAVAKLKY